METFEAPVFLRTAEDVAKVIEELFNDSSSKTPKIKAVLIQQREMVRKAFTERGTGTQSLLPLLAIKLTSIGLMQDGALNTFVLDKDGIDIAVDLDGNKYFFSGRQVIMTFSVTLFAYDYKTVLGFIYHAMMLRPQLHFYQTLEPGIKFPNVVAIDSSNFSVPEMNQESEITPFEFEFSMTISSYSGRISLVPKSKEVRVSGGPMMEVDGKKIALMGELAITKTG